MDHDVLGSIMKRSGPASKHKIRLLLHCLKGGSSNAKATLKGRKAGGEGKTKELTQEELTRRKEERSRRALSTSEGLGVMMYLAHAPRFVFAVGEKGAIIRSADRCRQWRRMKAPILAGGGPLSNDGGSKEEEEMDSGNNPNLLSENELDAILNLLPKAKTHKEEMEELPGDDDDERGEQPAGGGIRAAASLSAKSLLVTRTSKAPAGSAATSTTTTGGGGFKQLDQCPDLHGVACWKDIVVVTGAQGFIAISHDKGVTFTQIPFLVDVGNYVTTQQRLEQEAGLLSGTGGVEVKPIMPPPPKTVLRQVVMVPSAEEKVGESPSSKSSAIPICYCSGGSYLFRVQVSGGAAFKKHQSEQYAMKAASTGLGLSAAAADGEGNGASYSWQSEGEVELVKKFDSTIGCIKLLPDAEGEMTQLVVSTKNSLHFAVGTTQKKQIPFFVPIAHSLGLLRDLVDVTGLNSESEMARTFEKLGETLIKQNKDGGVAAPSSTGSSKQYSYSSTTVHPLSRNAGGNGSVEEKMERITEHIFSSSRIENTRVLSVLGSEGPLVTYDFTAQLVLTRSKNPPPDMKVPEGTVPLSLASNAHRVVFIPFVQSTVQDKVGLAVKNSGMQVVRSTMGGLNTSVDAGEKFSDPSQAYTGELAVLDDSCLIAGNLKKAVVLSEDFGLSWTLMSLPSSLKVATLNGVAVMQ